MTDKHIQEYIVYRSPSGCNLMMEFEDEGGEQQTIIVQSMSTVFKFADLRSPEWIVTRVGDAENVVRRWTNWDYIRSNPRSRRSNPSLQPTGPDTNHYRFFHGVDPNEVIDMECWVPGSMVLVGVGKDVGYGILNKQSKKDGWYVHDFGAKVKVYRRARKGEQTDKIWSSFPRQLTSLGYNIGFTYLDGGVDGNMKEVKGSQKKYLAVTPNRKTLVVVGKNGVEYLMEGGDMRVDDWIRD